MLHPPAPIARCPARPVPAMWLLLAVVLFVAGFALPALAETYSWTDADGTLHFSDDAGSAPGSARALETDPTDIPADMRPEIVGRWSNQKNSYSTMVVTFRGDRSGELSTAVGQVPFSWVVSANGHIRLELQEPSELSRRGRRQRTLTIVGEYDQMRDVIVLRDEEKQEKFGTLYPDDTDREAKKPGRVHAPSRLKFGEKTVFDKLTGLTWARSLDLPGSLRRHRNAGQFLMELSDRGYGDMVDWRLPTVGEMQEIVRALEEFGRASGRSAATGSVPELLRWVGFIDPKGRCYWTSTEGEAKGERYAFSLEDEVQRSFGHQQTCGIWPVRGNRN